MIRSTQNDIYQVLAQSGWELKNVKFDKKRDLYVAEANATQGDKLSGFGPTESRALNDLLQRIRQRQLLIARTSRWTSSFVDQLADIAKAYSKAPVYEPKAAIAFTALGRDSKRRANAVRNHIAIEIVRNPEPYESAEKMHDDVRKRRRLFVSSAGLEHPIWSQEEVIDFRIAFDVLGYTSANADFSWEGTNEAFAHYAHLLPEHEQLALFSEVIAPAAYASYYRSYGPQKIALFPNFMGVKQEQENKRKGYPGVHPDTVIPPVAMPAVRREVSKVAQDGVYMTDPNLGWQSNVQPLENNAYQYFGDPLQSQASMDTAKLLDTEWAYLNQNDPVDLNRMKQAIINAFRVAFLSPRNKLQFNAVHYQDISHIDPYEDDPQVYWETLRKARRRWNTKYFGEAGEHMDDPWYMYMPQLQRIFSERHPDRGWEQAGKDAERFAREMHGRFEADIDAQTKGELAPFQVELKANTALKAFLKNAIAESKKPDQADPLQNGFDIEAAGLQLLRNEDFDDQAQDQAEGTVKARKYSPPMSMHILPLAQISQHVDELLKAALTDVHEHDGAGHHFRAVAMQIAQKYQIRGLGPKVCSFVWLFLQPMTSQLATIDTHIQEFLGYGKGSPENRDYFRMERELRAGLDAAGYSHLPLGVGQWAAWDYKRSGPGLHQDHSAMRVLDPTPYDEVPWEETGDVKKDYEPDQWWADTLPARQQAAREYEQQIGPMAKKKIPWGLQNPPMSPIPVDTLNVPQENVISKTAAAFMHPDTNEVIQVPPGETKMNHMRNLFKMSVPDVWAAIGDDRFVPDPMQITSGWITDENKERAFYDDPSPWWHPEWAVQHNGQMPNDEALMGPLNFGNQNQETTANPVWRGYAGETPVYLKKIIPNDAPRERAAYMMAHTMGVNMPETVIRPGVVPPHTNEYTLEDNEGGEHPYVYVSRDVGGAPFMEDIGIPEFYENFPEDARRIALFDRVIGNDDRHLGNIIQGDDGKIYAIDHGFSFKMGPASEYGHTQYNPELPPEQRWQRYLANEPLRPEEVEMLQNAKKVDLQQTGLHPILEDKTRERIQQMLDSRTFA